MQNLIQDVIQWGYDKKLITPKNSFKQFAKSIEEFRELVIAIRDEDSDEIIDGFGDVMVTLIILMEQNDIDSKAAYKTAHTMYRSGERWVWDFMDWLPECLDEYGKISSALFKENSMVSYMIALISLLIGMASEHGLGLEECLQAAYNEIKNRKGKTIDGKFIKESDLK